MTYNAKTYQSGCEKADHLRHQDRYRKSDEQSHYAAAQILRNQQGKKL